MQEPSTSELTQDGLHQLRGRIDTLASARHTSSTFGEHHTFKQSDFTPPGRFAKIGAGVSKDGSYRSSYKFGPHVMELLRIGKNLLHWGVKETMSNWSTTTQKGAA